MIAPDDPAAKNTRAALVLSLQHLGVTEAERQRHVCAVWARRPIASRTELTEREAGSLVARLRTMSGEELADVLARPAPVADAEPEPPTLPPGAIACRPGTLTEHDAEQVRRFAEFLDQAGPAPSREELAAVTWTTMLEADDPPAPPSPTSEAEAFERRGGSAAEPDPPAPDVPPCEPPCEDVEAAAEEAVRRFRERQAAGIAPEAPDLSSIPRRVAAPTPPAPGRYCLTVCYCGTCPHWTPIPPVDYSKTPGSKDHERIHGKWR